MKYPKVEHSHIVPRSYTRRFAHDDKVAMRLLGQPHSRVISTRDAALRSGFYRRERPDGTPIHDFEWGLSQLEDKAAPILRDLDELWPLEKKQKAVLAELFAMQLIRGPRWRDWHESFVRESVNKHRKVELDAAAAAEAEEIARRIDTTERHLLSDTHWVIRMLSLGPKLAGILGSMHWARIEFARPLIVTSDHAVVPWPLHAGARRPEATTGDGLLKTLEVRVPASARQVILMTWAEEEDRARARLRGAPHHAGSLNTFTIAHAEKQWFHLPDTSPPVAAGGPFLPIAPELLLDYDVAAHASRRRAKASQWIDSVRDRPWQSRDFEIVTIP